MSTCTTLRRLNLHGLTLPAVKLKLSFDAARLLLRSNPGLRWVEDKPHQGGREGPPALHVHLARRQERAQQASVCDPMLTAGGKRLCRGFAPGPALHPATSLQGAAAARGTVERSHGGKAGSQLSAAEAWLQGDSKPRHAAADCTACRAAPARTSHPRCVCDSSLPGGTRHKVGGHPLPDWCQCCMPCRHTVSCELRRRLAPARPACRYGWSACRPGRGPRTTRTLE